MKKLTSLLIAFCLIFGLATPMASAASVDQNSVQQAIQALGIITGDDTGNLNLSGYVTRAQFAKMMISASSYKDAISSTASSSPFKDVNYKNWAASYVQTAVSAGWLTGYADGTYRPNNNVKLEEAVSATLKMLGYVSSDFAGAFPDAQLAKYSALRLNFNISTVKGQNMTRQDCMYLFYNLMGTKNKSGNYYATTLGYSVNGSGELDYSSLVLNNMKGPYIVADSSWTSTLPFTTDKITVYKNGSLSTVSSINKHDVYYYNSSMRSVWVYRNQVSGVYTAASPNSAAPSSVTVAGKSYTVSTASASYALSTVGSYKIGSTVTLLLGMNGDVVGVVSSNDLSTTKFGIVISTGTKTYSDSSGNNYSSNTITIASTDGNSYDYNTKTTSYKEGDLVRVSFSGGESSVSLINNNSLSGTVNSSATAIGTNYFSDDIKILDTTSNGSYCKVFPARLAGLYLDSNSIRYYALDDKGKISELILNDVTGDMYQYGILTSVSESYDSMSVSSSYKYVINGSSGTFSSYSLAFGVSEGPAQFEISGTSVERIKNLTSVTLISLNALYAQSGDNKYKLADNVSVYINTNGSYNLSSISSLINSSGYTLYGYYDKSESYGGRMRVIIAR